MSCSRWINLICRIVLALAWTTAAVQAGKPEPERAQVLRLLEEGLPQGARVHRGVPKSDKKTWPRPVGQETFRYGGQNYFQASLKATPDQTQRLREFILDPQVLVEWKGQTMCRGFHGDYLIEFHYQDKSSIYVAMCYSCMEARIYYEKLELTVSQERDPARPLARLLAEIANSPPHPRME